MTQLILSNSEIGTHSANITKRAEESIEIKYLLCKFGSSADVIKICGAADFPIGIVTDTAFAADEIVNVALLNSSDTLKVVAAAAISAGTILTPADDGKVAALASGTPGLMVGVALTSAAAGQEIEIMSCVPQQYEITAN